MGPRLSTGGNGATSRRARWPTSRFNGAPSLDGGEREFSAPAPYAKWSLQWGPVSRRGGTQPGGCSTRDGPPSSFNGAPSLDGGEHGQLREVERRAVSASMGPRLSTGGNARSSARFPS